MSDPLRGASYKATMELRWFQTVRGGVKLQQRWISEDGLKDLWQNVEVVEEVTSDDA